MAASDLDFQRLCNGEDILVRSDTLFPSLAICNRPFDVRGPYGTHSTWCCPFLLGPSSSGMAISEISHVAPLARPAILRLLGGEMPR